MRSHGRPQSRTEERPRFSLERRFVSRHESVCLPAEPGARPGVRVPTRSWRHTSHSDEEALW